MVPGTLQVQVPYYLWVHYFTTNHKHKRLSKKQFCIEIANLRKKNNTFKMLRECSKTGTLLLLVSSASITNALTLKSYRPYERKGRLVPKLQSSPYTSYIYNVRGGSGGVMEKKVQQPAFVISDNDAKVADISQKKTDVHTQSSVVQASCNVDRQYKTALVKTALTVFSAGK